MSSSGRVESWLYASWRAYTCCVEHGFFFQGDYYNLVIFILSWFLRITVSKLLLMQWSENQHFYSHLSTSDIHVYLVTLMATYSPVQQAVENRTFRAAWKFKCLRSLFLSGWRKFSKARTWKMCFSTIVVHAAVRAMLTTQKNSILHQKQSEVHDIFRFEKRH